MVIHVGESIKLKIPLSNRQHSTRQVNALPTELTREEYMHIKGGCGEAGKLKLRGKKMKETG